MLKRKRGLTGFIIVASLGEFHFPSRYLMAPIVALLYIQTLLLSQHVYTHNRKTSLAKGTIDAGLSYLLQISLRRKSFGTERF